MKRHASVIVLALLLVGCATRVHSPTEQPSQSADSTRTNLPPLPRELLKYMTVVAGTNPGVYVEGEVKKAGRFNCFDGLTLTNAIDIAGGFTDFANQNRLKIQHADGTLERYSYRSVVRGLTNNPILRPLDQVLVLKRMF